jgi:hypothetical protein
MMDNIMALSLEIELYLVNLSSSERKQAMKTMKTMNILALES